MSSRRFNSLPDQVAGRMREEIAKGRWTETVPGRDKLVKEFGVSGKTVEAALQLLQKEGLLVSQGPGRRRRIVAGMNSSLPSLKVAILTFESLAMTEGYMIEMQHQLNEAGHSAFFASKSLAELGFDVKRVSRLVKETKADAWVVQSSPHEILGWMARQSTPVFALFGRRRGLPIAGTGPDKDPAYQAATRKLLDLGHKRIVLLTRKARRIPIPGASEKLFLGELAAAGVTPSNYNLPDWEETVDGFHQGLKSIFQITPPTALIVDESQFFLAALQFCANRGLRVPDDVSLVSTDDDPRFAWFTPSVAHIRWDRKAVMRRIERWAANISRNKSDLRQTFTKAKFIEGGTVGPVGEDG
jgi:LacI family transcriptional regulator